jgi:hypothetical protein
MAALQQKAWVQDDINSIDSHGVKNPTDYISQILDSQYVDRFKNVDLKDATFDDPMMYYMSDPLKRAYLSVKERKTLAVSTIDCIIDLWKQLFNFCTSSMVSQTERSLKALYTNLTGGKIYDHVCMKRSLLINMIHILLPVWLHPCTSNLPTLAFRSLADVVQQSVKCITEVKAFPIYSEATERKKTTNATRIAAFRSNSSTESSHNSSSTATTYPWRQTTSFVADESTITSFINMGFTRNNILSAMASLQSNNIDEIMEGLVMNQFPILSAAAIAAIPTTASAPIGTVANTNVDVTVTADSVGAFENTTTTTVTVNSDSNIETVIAPASNSDVLYLSTNTDNDSATTGTSSTTTTTNSAASVSPSAYHDAFSVPSATYTPRETTHGEVSALAKDLIAVVSERSERNIPYMSSASTSALLHIEAIHKYGEVAHSNNSDSLTERLNSINNEVILFNTCEEAIGSARMAEAALYPSVRDLLHLSQNIPKRVQNVLVLHEANCKHSPILCQIAEIGLNITKDMVGLINDCIF